MPGTKSTKVNVTLGSTVLLSRISGFSGVKLRWLRSSAKAILLKRFQETSSRNAESVHQETYQVTIGIDLYCVVWFGSNLERLQFRRLLDVLLFFGTMIQRLVGCALPFAITTNVPTWSLETTHPSKQQQSQKKGPRTAVRVPGRRKRNVCAICNSNRPTDPRKKGDTSSCNQKNFHCWLRVGSKRTSLEWAANGRLALPRTRAQTGRVLGLCVWARIYESLHFIIHCEKFFYVFFLSPFVRPQEK